VIKNKSDDVVTYEIEILDNNNLFYNRQYYSSVNKIFLEIDKFCERQDTMTKYESKEEDKTFFNKKLVYSGDIIEIESDMIMYKFNIFKLIVK
jgi:hypothetical protein